MVMPPPQTTGLILAGGRATRLGGADKALLSLAGRPLITHVIARLGPQVDRLAINSNAPAEHYAHFGLAVIPDRLPGHLGPLAGIHAGLCTWPGDRLVTVAVDLPFLPTDLVARLAAGAEGAPCAYASDGRRHALAILWRPAMGEAVAAFLAHGGRRLGDWLAGYGRAVVFPPGPAADLMFNVNTPDALRLAEGRLSPHTMAPCPRDP